MIVLSLFKGLIEVKPPVTMRSILYEVARQYDLTPAEMFTKSQARRYAHPRHEFMWRCREIKNPDGSHRYSLTQIGSFLGGMDHTSVKHGADSHRARTTEQARAA